MLTIHNKKRPVRPPVVPETPSTILIMKDVRPKIAVPETPKMLSLILTTRDIPKRARAQEELIRRQRIERAERVEPQGVWNTLRDTPIPAPVGGRAKPTPFHYVMRDGAWKGHRAFMVGGGASLKDFDWGLLKGELTIGINRAVEVFDPSIVFSMDLRMWSYYERGDLGEMATERFRAYKGNKVWSVTPNFILPEEAYYIPRPKRSIGYGLGTLKEMETANNSGYGGLQLALALGADPVYLLGLDMEGDSKGKQAWWHNGYPAGQSGRVYLSMIEHFNKFAKTIKGTGLNIVNLSPNSKLQCFRKQDPMEVLGKKVKRPIVVSFYTENTGYAHEADRLMESLHRFGLEYDIQPRPNMGGWKKNNDYKPTYILEMMEKHPGRDIVWIDCDAIVLQYPELWDDANIGIGVHTVDWALYRDHNMRKEMLAGTIYVGNTLRIKAFVKSWIKRMITHPKYTDQQNLEALLRDKKDWTMQLPASYCQIFDTMAKAGDPVIEHGQASRRLKKEVGA